MADLLQRTNDNATFASMAFDQAIAEQICERLSAGYTLAEICRSDGMPADRTIRDWIAENTLFSADIARAREIGHDIIAARTRKVARGTDPDASGDVQRDRLIVDTDLRLLAKWNKRYADKVHSDVDMSITVTVVNPFPVAQDALQATIVPQPAIEQDK